MGYRTRIEWADSSWNPWLGCTKVSPGCRNCYAERIEERFGRDFSVVRRASQTTFNSPLRWKKPRMVFTCSMSDFFHEDADPWRPEAWEIIRKTPWHTYQILTKRPERIPECLPEDWGDGWGNVWLGTSVEMQAYVGRVLHLLLAPAAIHFVSAEPLLGPIDFGKYPTRTLLRELDWTITGGESDPRSPRVSDPEWFRSVRDQCLEAGVAFLHKQNGGARRCSCHGAWGCRLLDGQIWDEMPPARRVAA